MWKSKFEELLPLLGHRNWILVVDKAYPLQSASGIEYLNSGEELPAVLEYVLGEVKGASHIKPVVYLDKELDYMHDGLAAGVDALKEGIFATLKGVGVEDAQQIPHDDIFTKLDAASKLFNVVVIKTECVLPYTSLFIELDCGYWNSAAEKNLRDSMK